MRSKAGIYQQYIVSLSMAVKFFFFTFLELDWFHFELHLQTVTFPYYLQIENLE